ncbi:NADH-quinone oxidoreductase subunit NuoF family protein [Streptomyces aidingensis]|uniref:NADH:ubiquinone oxidoreductase, NADH-binding subunit (Chain F) n=1 Tax=Streptomyces aidingensis TaxID=910347 RepID=A0A1I1JBB4_9ACTN|nr:NADH-quinone oxidoreductase subunit NuoF family protein [Streptomyces aidingensis]SFC45844.1 NADH:ubiquinone oxidoreductase, NADH-binding subunit (chain F) [Streptomyces aidingensis]
MTLVATGRPGPGTPDRPAEPGTPRLAALGPARLLAGVEGGGRLDRVGHLTVHGTPPRLNLAELIALAENIDLRGRGGAGFPFARKLRAVAGAAARRRAPAAVVVNGTEGEPACLKDKALLRHTPHLVIDGAELAAQALDAREIVFGVTRPDIEESLRKALAERPPAGVPVRVRRLPERFVTGEGSALTRGLDDGPALPAGRKVRTSDSGLGGLPTLLSNTETWAQLSVAARIGALAYRETGLPTEPGTVLLSLAGRLVAEVPAGAPLAEVLRLCGTDAGQGVLVGGYHGGWLSPRAAAVATVSRDSLSALGASLGAGAVVPLPADTCPVGETTRVARWMAEESAGQCGPCFLGLPAIADTLEWVRGAGGRPALDALQQRMASVRRRGACSHPDGTARFVASALDAFPEEFLNHSVGYGCGRPVTGALPLSPDGGRGARGSGGGRSAAVALSGDTGRRLTVDWTLCQGHGLCAGIAPDLVRLDSDGYPAQAAVPVPRAARGQAARAVRRCPALALRITG